MGPEVMVSIAGASRRDTSCGVSPAPVFRGHVTHLPLLRRLREYTRIKVILPDKQLAIIILRSVLFVPEYGLG